MRRFGFLAPVAAGVLLTACGGGGSSSNSSSTSSPASTPTPVTTTSSSATATGHAKVVITPTSGKVGSVIHVVGTGYSPNLSVTGTICALNAMGAVDNPLTDCDVVNTLTVTTDAMGGFTADYTIKRIPPAKAGGVGYSIGFGVNPPDPNNQAGAPITITP